jgi:hypothetical protein
MAHVGPAPNKTHGSQGTTPEHFIRRTRQLSQALLFRLRGSVGAKSLPEAEVGGEVERSVILRCSASPC